MGTRCPRQIGFFEAPMILLDNALAFALIILWASIQCVRIVAVLIKRTYSSPLSIQMESQFIVSVLAVIYDEEAHAEWVEEFSEDNVHEDDDGA